MVLHTRFQTAYKQVIAVFSTGNNKTDKYNGCLKALTKIKTSSFFPNTFKKSQILEKSGFSPIFQFHGISHSHGSRFKAISAKSCETRLVLYATFKKNRTKNKRKKIKFGHILNGETPRRRNRRSGGGLLKCEYCVFVFVFVFDLNFFVFFACEINAFRRE